LPKYVVRWNYGSALGGPWIEGQEVELQRSEAETINRDSPGVLTAVDDLTEPPEEQSYKCPYCGETFIGGSIYAAHKKGCADSDLTHQAMSSDDYGALIIK
jgi:hypothetical protein